MGAWDVYNKSLNDIKNNVDVIQNPNKKVTPKPTPKAKGLPEAKGTYKYYVDNGGVWTEDQWNKWNANRGK